MYFLKNEHIKITRDGIVVDFIGKEDFKNKCR